MTANDPLESVRERLELAEAEGISCYQCMGREFIVLPNVFPPTHFQSTGIFTSSLEYKPGTSFFEIGCGTGITAVTAALEGCYPVVASDISKDAAINTQANVDKYSLSDRISVRHGDLFDVLHEDETFDTIFWNSNFVFVPEDYTLSKGVDRAFCDPGYATHSRFLREVGRFLNPGGRILLGFSGQGNEQALDILLEQHGYTAITLSSKLGAGPRAHRYDILQLKKIGN